MLCIFVDIKYMRNLCMQEKFTLFKIYYDGQGMGMQNRNSVILADSHRIFRESLRSMIENWSHLELIGEAIDGKEAILLVQELVPDIAIIDASMPDMSIIEATRQINRILPDVKIIILSMYPSRRYAVEIIKAGALGYLLKDYIFGELANAIETVISDQTYLSAIMGGMATTGFIHNNAV